MKHNSIDHSLEKLRQYANVGDRKSFVQESILFFSEIGKFANSSRYDIEQHRQYQTQYDQLRLLVDSNRKVNRNSLGERLNESEQ